MSINEQLCVENVLCVAEGSFSGLVRSRKIQLSIQTAKISQAFLPPRALPGPHSTTEQEKVRTFAMCELSGVRCALTLRLPSHTLSRVNHWVLSEGVCPPKICSFGKYPAS